MDVIYKVEAIGSSSGKPSKKVGGRGCRPGEAAAGRASAWCSRCSAAWSAGGRRPRKLIRPQVTIRESGELPMDAADLAAADEA
jgi:hypothetical protein